MEENYCALALAIIKDYTPEQAFEVLENGCISRVSQKNATQEMIRLKEAGLSYREIGDIFGIPRIAAYRRIGRAVGRLKS